MDACSFSGTGRFGGGGTFLMTPSNTPGDVIYSAPAEAWSITGSSSSVFAPDG